MKLICMSVASGILLLGASCAGSPDPDVQGSEQALGPQAIGSPCVESDGWRPVPIPEPPANSAAARMPHADPVPQGWQDYPSVGHGTLYCLPPDSSSEYPYGYLTSNCQTDKDCTGSKCDGDQCRRPCTQDAECRAPMICGPATGPSPVRFCRCLSCLR
jgi:hypothetical protein